MLQKEKNSTFQASLNSSNVFFVSNKITTFLLELPVLQLWISQSYIATTESKLTVKTIIGDLQTED